MVVLGKDVCVEKVGATGSYSLRVGGLFAILFGSAILTFLPIAARNRCQLLLQLGSCFATGVVLATAFVHMIPDATAAMTSTCLAFSGPDGYPWASAIAGFVVVISLVIENTLKGVMLKNFGATGLDDLDLPDIHSGADSHSAETGVVTQTQHSTDNIEDGRAMKLDGKAGHREKLQQADKVMTAIFLEGGIVFHSIFVGINYGILEDDGTSTALLIALIFHQAFDGLALGSAFVRANFGWKKYCSLAVVFVLITPIGIAIGIGVSKSYAPGSKAALGTEAAFNSFSAGLLVYNALINLMATQFKPVAINWRPFLQVGQYMALALGYCAMAFVGKYA